MRAESVLTKYKKTYKHSIHCTKTSNQNPKYKTETKIFQNKLKNESHASRVNFDSDIFSSFDHWLSERKKKISRNRKPRKINIKIRKTFHSAALTMCPAFFLYFFSLSLTHSLIHRGLMTLENAEMLTFVNDDEFLLLLNEDLTCFFL
jgi:hypothetical protein